MASSPVPQCQAEPDPFLNRPHGCWGHDGKPAPEAPVHQDAAVTGKHSKRLGQHFLTDENTIAAIVQAIAPARGQNILEIGPGLGAITLPVLRSAGAMHAIEIDQRLSDALPERCAQAGALTLHQGDVLKFDLNRVASSSHPVRLIGNLPYNISTPLLFHLQRFTGMIVDMHFMLQKEVVERITARPGTSAYSRLSVSIQSCCRVENLFDITPDMFSPPPKVISSFMRLRPESVSLEKIHSQTLFDELVRTAFQQRRKTIKNSLAKMVTETQLRQAAIDPGKRPQEIPVQQYINLANLLSG